MKNLKIFILIIAQFFIFQILYNCKNNVKISDSDYNNVVVLDINDKIPNNSKFVTKIQIGYLPPYLSLYKNYDSLIVSAKQKAFKIHGNILKIRSHTPYQYNIGESEIILHKIKAEVYYFDNIDSLRNKESKTTNIRDKKIKLNFYMFYQGLANKNIYVNDSLITKLKSKTKYTFYPNKEGIMSVKCGKDGIPVSINVLKGKNYYLKCNIKLGIIKNTPYIELKDSIVGAKEFNSFD